MSIEIAKRKVRMATTLGVFAAFFVAIAIFGSFFNASYAGALGQDNQNVTVLLNVSNTEPIVYDVIFYDPADGLGDEDIVLTAGATTEVVCNVSASDYNGQDDLVNASAHIYVNYYDPLSAINNATHYENESCGSEFFDVPATTTNRTFTCRFIIDYYAFNDTWTCNATVYDAGGTEIESNETIFNSSGVDNAFINELIAINLTTTILDYGNLSVLEESPEENINITNAGNTRTNFTVLGYGGTNQTGENRGNLSFICQLGNISIYQQKYSNVTGATFESMINLTGNATLISNVTLLNRTNNDENLVEGVMNTTYWKIRVPLSVGGSCNGTIQFAATTAAS